MSLHGIGSRSWIGLLQACIARSDALSRRNALFIPGKLTHNPWMSSMKMLKNPRGFGFMFMIGLLIFHYCFLAKVGPGVGLVHGV